MLLCFALATLVLAPPVRAEDAADILRYRGADREPKLIEGAKREGQVVIYSAMIVNQALRPLADSFGKKYPFLKLTYWRADSEDIMQKISAEVRATNVVADIVEGTGVSELAAQAGLVQPFVTPALAAYPEAYRDPQGLWVPTRLSYYSVAYNTRLAPPNVAPKTYADLLDPQWKGKIEIAPSETDFWPIVSSVARAKGHAAALAWLEHREPRIAIGPRPTEHVRLTLDDAQLARVLWVCVVGLPLFMLLVGAGIFWIRRS